MIKLEDNASFVLLEGGADKLTEETPPSTGSVALEGGVDLLLLEDSGKVLRESGAGGVLGTISPNGVAVAVTFGSPSVARGNVNVSPNGLAVAVSMGSPTVTPSNTISVTGLAVPFSTGSPLTGVAFDAAADRLNISSQPANPANCSATFWFRAKSSTQADSILIEIDQGGGWAIMLLTAGVLQHLTGGFALVSQPTGVAVTWDQWYFGALTINGTTAKSYQGDETTAVVSATGTTTNGSSFKFSIGGANSAPTLFPTADMALVRLWDRVLSPAEVEAERTSRTPASTTNLVGDWRLNGAANKFVDSSGNGNTLSAPGAGPWQDATGPSIGGSGATITSAATISPNGLAVPVAFGSAAVSLASGAQTVSPNGLAVAVAFGAPAVSSAATISGTGLAVAVAFGSATISASNTISPTGLAVAVALGTPAVSAGNVTISPNGLAVAVAFGAPAVTSNATISPNGLAVAVAFGAPAVSSAATISPNGLAVPVAFGAPAVSSAATISGTGLAVAVAFGSATISASNTISPTGLAVAVAFGAPAVSSNATVNPNGLSVAASFGSATVTPAGVSISPTGYAVTVALGSPTVSATRTVSPNGLAVGVSFGAPSVTPAGVSISLSGLAVAVAFGSASVSGGFIAPSTINPTGLAVAAAFGLAQLYNDPSRPIERRPFGSSRFATEERPYRRGKNRWR